MYLSNRRALHKAERLSAISSKKHAAQQLTTSHPTPSRALSVLAPQPIIPAGLPPVYHQRFSDIPPRLYRSEGCNTLQQALARTRSVFSMGTSAYCEHPHRPALPLPPTTHRPSPLTEPAPLFTAGRRGGASPLSAPRPAPAARPAPGTGVLPGAAPATAGRRAEGRWAGRGASLRQKTQTDWGRFRLGIRKTDLPERVVMHRSGLPREVVTSPSLEMSVKCGDVVLANMV